MESGVRLEVGREGGISRSAVSHDNLSPAGVDFRGKMECLRNSEFGEARIRELDSAGRLNFGR